MLPWFKRKGEGFPAYELAQKQYLTFMGGQNK